MYRSDENRHVGVVGAVGGRSGESVVKCLEVIGVLFAESLVGELNVRIVMLVVEPERSVQLQEWLEIVAISALDLLGWLVCWEELVGDRIAIVNGGNVGDVGMVVYPLQLFHLRDI